MAERRMLRDAMPVDDIYTFAEPIIDMLREEYGSYDGDSLEEVFVDEPFLQRLQDRGYNVQGLSALSALEAGQTADIAVATPETERRTTTGSDTSSARTTRSRSKVSASVEAASGDTNTPQPEPSTPTRARRTTKTESTGQASRTTKRTTRTARSTTNEAESTEA